MTELSPATLAIRRDLRHHDSALGGQVAGLFYVEAIICFELSNGYIVGLQVAREHGCVETVLAPVKDLPPMFTKARRAKVPNGMSFLLVGRRFRGVFGHEDSGDVSCDFGRYRVRCDLAKGHAYIESRQHDARAFWDLPEDEHLSIKEQLRNAQTLLGSDAKVV